MPRHPAFQLGGKSLTVIAGQGRRPAGLDAAAAQCVHEIAHVEQALHIVSVIKLAARIQRAGAFADNGGSQRDIGSDDQITGGGHLNDMVVSDIKAAGHLHHADPRRARNLQRTIGDQRELQRCPLRRPIKDVLDDAGTGVSINPDRHPRRFLVRGQPEHGFVLIAELRHQTGFPGEILLHRLTVAGMAVMHKKQVVDAFAVRRTVG